MHKLSGVLRPLLLALAVLSLSLTSQADSNKYRIKFNHEAKVDGELVFVVTPGGDEPIVVTVEIPEGMNENRAANKTETALKRELERSMFHVERDDFEDVLVKKDRGEEDFDLKLKSNTVDGLSVKVHRE
jgi:hypothetical protein